MPLWPQINVEEANKKILQDDSFTYMGRIISKNCGWSEDVRRRIAKHKMFFFTFARSIVEKENLVDYELKLD